MLTTGSRITSEELDKAAGSMSWKSTGNGVLEVMNKLFELVFETFARLLRLCWRQ
jgi:hypothetical protein